MRDETKVAKVRSAADGSFTLRLPSGTYQLSATSQGGFQATVSQTVDVPSQGDVRIMITLDSGIR